MAMTAKDLDDTLAAIARQAKALRDGGVFGRVTIGDVSFNIETPLAMVMPTSSGQPEVDPIDDEVTYGTSGVPQRRKPASQDAVRSEFEKE